MTETIDQGDKMRLPSPKSEELPRLLWMVLDENPESLLLTRSAELVAQKYIERNLPHISVQEENELVNDFAGSIRTRLSIMVHALTWVKYEEQEKKLKNGPIRKLPTIRKNDGVYGDFETYQNQQGGPESTMLPTWFRESVSTAKMLEHQIEKSRSKPADSDLEQGLEELICASQEEIKSVPPLILDISTRQWKNTLWSYIRDVELNQKDDPELILLYLLYKFRAATAQQVVRFMLDSAYRPDRWYQYFDLRSLFANRFRQFNNFGGGSVERQGYWIEDLSMMLGKQTPDLDDVLNYVRLAFEHMMWYSLKTRDPFFWKNEKKAADEYWTHGNKIVKKIWNLKAIKVNLVQDRAHWLEVDRKNKNMW